MRRGFENGALTMIFQRQMKTAAVMMALACPLFLGPALAQNGQFAPVKMVNNQVISGYELDQRMQFLQLLRQPGDLRNVAIDGLIEDRLRMGAAKALGIAVSNDDVMAGMTEFASRANMSAEEFVSAIGQAGVAPETFRDFVSAGLIWRQVIRARYDGRITISEKAIDRALANFDIPVAQSVTLAEIVLPAPEASRNAALTQGRDLKIDIMRGRDFAEAARSASSGPTARNGGTLAPKLLSELPEQIAKAVRVLTEGEVSPPMLFEGNVVIYKMLASGDEQIAISGPSQIDYAEVLISASDTKAAAILRSKVDTCDDLYSLVDPARLTRKTVATGAVPADVSGALSLLDAGEVSTQAVRGGAQVFLMLCSRGAPVGAQASRDEIRLMLKNQRLGAMAAIYLEELRADALITDP